MKNRARAILSLAVSGLLAASLSGCTGGLPGNLNGTIKVTQVIQTKTSCTVKVTASNGRNYTANIGPSCYGVKKGMTFKVVNGQVRR